MGDERHGTDEGEGRQRRTRAARASEASRPVRGRRWASLNQPDTRRQSLSFLATKDVQEDRTDTEQAESEAVRDTRDGHKGGQGEQGQQGQQGQHQGRHQRASLPCESTTDTSQRPGTKPSRIAA